MSSPIPQRGLGGDASAVKVGQVGLGLMSLTWVAPDAIVPDAQCFELFKAAIDAGTTFFDAGAFYGPPNDPYANLRLLKRFFDAEPAYAAKIVLSVKGGMHIPDYAAKGVQGLHPDVSIDYLRSELKEIREILKCGQEGGHEIDVYEPARKPKDVTPEELITTVKTLHSEGLFKHAALSEVNADTIRRAAKLFPLAGVEVEYSPIERTAETNGVLEACEELQIPLFAYSPLGKGFLGNGIKSINDVPKGDIRAHLERFSEENLSKNVSIATKYAEFASSHSPPLTASQLTLAWLIHQSPSRLVIPIPGTSKAARATENAKGASVSLSKEEVQNVTKLLEDNGFAGGRYNEMMRQHGALWS